jgi:hypothetical protein
LQFGDSLAALACRHVKASGPPGCTPRQLRMKSARQVFLMAACCSGVGIAGATATAAAAGVVATAAAVAAGFGAPPMALTACRQAGDSFDALVCRQTSAA